MIEFVVGEKLVGWECVAFSKEIFVEMETIYLDNVFKLKNIQSEITTDKNWLHYIAKMTRIPLH